ncbi:MAG: hypothetical protein JO250_14045 [Armatimonadetes bacterium]|nr:hypothetical protein [Armatimonadota bacterium]
MKPVTGGTFRDASGQAHPWHITQAHLLEWDGAPYLPVGGAFTPHFWAEGQTDAAWDADTQALQTLKQHGVTDLYLYAGAGGLTRVPPAAVQRLLDYLDASGFHYGLEIADFPKDPLVGYVVKPSVYRDPSPPYQGQARFSHIAGLQDAIYMLVSGSEVQPPGAAKIIDGETAQVDIQEAPPGDVLLLYPRRRFGAGTPESHLPDLWQGYDEYRDRLLAFFSRVRLGKGFRFFLDPLTDRLGMNGEVQNLIPTTQGFRQDFEVWLHNKYSSEDALTRRWGLEDRNQGFDFPTAARCIPLWYQFKGDPALYDPIKGGPEALYPVINKPVIKSAYWDDLQAFKIESTRGYMNAIAEALKKGVADVPVIYKWTQHSPLFTNTSDGVGYDGIGMEAYGTGLALSRDAGAYAYAQAQETPKTTWLIVSGTAETPPEEKTTPGFVSKATLFDDWDHLKDIGARGFFAQALQRLPADDNKNVNLLAVPDQLAWLGSYAATLQASARDLATQRPQVLWYPQDVAGPDVGVRLLPGDVWWLPTYRPGQGLLLGPDLLGYSLTDPTDGQPLNVLWSPRDASTSARFDLGKTAAPTVTSAAGAPLPAPHSKGVWTIPVGAAPTLVRGVPTLPLSLDAPAAAEEEARHLLALADSERIDVELLRQQFFHTENATHDTPADAPVRYQSFRQIVDGLTLALRPYVWQEGEDTSENTFDAVTPDPEASGGAYLSLDTDRAPPPLSADSPGAYRAVYKFPVSAPGLYTLWMAGTPPGTPAASPFTYQIDEGTPSGTRDAPSEGGAYAGKFVWSQLGDAKLARGPHTLTITVTGRRALDKHYALALDAFCITRAPFHPDGTRQPPIDIPPDIAASADKDKGKGHKR